jgi:hypothetical protein
MMRRMLRVAVVLSCLGAAAAPFAVSVGGSSVAHSSVLAGGPEEPDPVNWCYFTRSCWE